MRRAKLYIHPLLLDLVAAEGPAPGDPTYRSLMRLHAVRRDRASALRVYHECVTVLEREWRRLQATWRTARSGQAHVVYVAGEASIGKTRLAEELLTWTGQQSTTMARAATLPKAALLSRPSSTGCAPVPSELRCRMSTRSGAPRG